MEFLIRLLELLPRLPGGIGRAMQSRDYRLYACGHIVQVHGWWSGRVAIGWLAWQLTESAEWLGIIAFAGLIPSMLIAPFAGAWADRYGHRKMAMSFGFVCGMVNFTLGTLALLGLIDIWIMLGLVILQGILFGLEFPARQALIPQLVTRENIPAAIAFNATLFQVGGFLGPALAGIMILQWGPGSVIMFFGFGTMWMAGMISLVSHRAKRTGAREGATILVEIGQAFAYAFTDRALRLLFVVQFACGLLLRPINDLLPGFADHVFNRGETGLAVLNSVFGAGALIVAVVLLVRSKTKGMAGIMLTGSIGAGLGFVVFAMTPDFHFALAALFVAAMLLLAQQVGTYSLIQSMVRPEMRGRIISLNVATAVGAPATGALVQGWLAAAIGFPNALAVCGACAAAVVALLLPAVRRHAGEMEHEPG